MSGRQSGDADSTYTFDDVAVVVGTDSDAEAIGTVLADIATVTDGRAELICVTGSRDGTPDIAQEHGATVVESDSRATSGVRAAVLASDRPVVVTTDADGSYPMEWLPDFLAAINDGADVVSGDRRYYGAGGKAGVNRLGNELLALLAAIATGTRVHDATTGLRAYRREVVQKIQWTEDTGLSAELLVRPLMRGYDVRERPIECDDRTGEADPDAFGSGAAIATSILKVAVEERLR